VTTQRGAAGLSWPLRALLDELPHQGPVPNGPDNDFLRQLVIHYSHEPNSQVAVIRIEPGQPYGVMVHIT
jgi:hypothetical protein